MSGRTILPLSMPGARRWTGPRSSANRRRTTSPGEHRGEPQRLIKRPEATKCPADGRAVDTHAQTANRSAATRPEGRGVLADGPVCLDPAASQRAALEPAPEPPAEAGPVCIATNIGVSAVQRVDAGRYEPEHRGKGRRTRCRAVEDEDREDRKSRDERKEDASPGL